MRAATRPFYTFHGWLLVLGLWLCFWLWLFESSRSKRSRFLDGSATHGAFTHSSLDLIVGEVDITRGSVEQVVKTCRVEGMSARTAHSLVGQRIKTDTAFAITLPAAPPRHPCGLTSQADSGVPLDNVSPYCFTKEAGRALHFARAVHATDETSVRQTK